MQTTTELMTYMQETGFDPEESPTYRLRIARTAIAVRINEDEVVLTSMDRATRATNWQVRFGGVPDAIIIAAIEAAIEEAGG